MNEDVIFVSAEHIAELAMFMIKLSKEAEKKMDIKYAEYCKGVSACCVYILEKHKSRQEENSSESEEGEDSHEDEILQVYFENPEAAEEE